MDYAPTRIAGPIVDPVSLAEVRRHCRVSTNDDDELLNALTAAAIGHFDGWQGILNRCLITQTWQQTFDSFYSLELPFPVLSSVSVKYDDANGVEQTVDTGDYRLRLSKSSRSFIEALAPAAWPGTSGGAECVRVQFTAGFGPAAADVPAPIRQAILLTVGSLYAHTKSDVGLKRLVIEGVGTKEWDNTGAMMKTNEVAVDRLISPFRLAVI